jgi:Icc protein
MRLIQLSDLHLGNCPRALVNNFPVYDSFVQLFNLALRYQPDHLLLTGDLSNNGDLQSYELLENILSTADIPVSILYGNHDRPCEVMRHRLIKSITFPNWQILCLDSVKPNAVWGEGRLSTAELAWLKQSLLHAEANVLIALHHHPITFTEEDLSWLNQIHLENSTELLSLVAEFSQVKGIIFGHIHREVNKQIGCLSVYGCPATCYQVSTVNDDKNCQWSGFRVIDLLPNGKLRTQVVRLPSLFSTPK